MKRLPLLAAMLLCAAPAWAEVSTTFGFHMDITNAPPPPRVVYVQEPRCVAVPNTRVYVVESDDDDRDFFRYGTYWYMQTGGYWYRARTYRGPFTVVRVSAVPPVILNVPGRYWRAHPHGGPPGQMKKRHAMRRGPDVVVVKEKGHGRGHH